MDTTFLDRQLGDFVCILGMALRAGYSLRQAMEAMSDRAPEPTVSVCRGSVADLEAGCTYDEAFANVQAAWPSPYLAQIVETIVRHQQTGGNLADQLDPLSEQIYQAVGSDEALYPEMRKLAHAVQGPLPERAREE
ncbi:MAG: type II secretion system F family protein [Anaerolineales bacterium]|nr:MAG: type II secretion system F family protein [Anaerolineales bacterium]